MIIKRKLYTQYDMTDRLKGMKDSDILAEKRKTQPVGRNLVSGAISTGIGAATGGAIGAGIGMATGKKGARLAKAGRFGKLGAVIGGVAAAGKAISSANKTANENSFYNDRLEYAQRQAQRRERKDWKTNMTQRDGYSY